MSTDVTSPTFDDLSGLRPSNEAGSIRTYVRGLVARRDYIWYVAANELRSRQMNTVLGNLWHLLNPLLQMGVYYLVFGVIVGTDKGVDNFLTFLAAGIFTYQFTQKATMAGARSIVANIGILRSISFPRAVLPITSTLTQALETLPTLAVLFVVAVATGETPHVSWLLIPVIFAWQFVFNVGAAFAAARATTHFRDTEQILPFVFRLLFYMSGVIFSVETYIEEHGWRWLFELNPLYCFITIARWSVLRDDISTGVIVSAAAWTVGLFVVGFWWFRRGEEAYGRE